MWIVAKIKNKEFHTFKRSLNERLSFKPELYSPKIIIDSFIKNKQKKKIKYILENYVFLKHEKFSDQNLIYSIKFLRGLDKILPFFISSQKEISNFINKCRENENSDGYLSQDFFNLYINKEIKFKSGPFSKFVGALVEIQKNNIKVLIKDYLVTIDSKKTIVF